MDKAKKNPLTECLYNFECKLCPRYSECWGEEDPEEDKEDDDSDEN